MTPQVGGFLLRLRESDVPVTVYGGKLRLNLPEGGLTDVVKSEIAARDDRAKRTCRWPIAPPVRSVLTQDVRRAR